MGPTELPADAVDRRRAVLLITNHGYAGPDIPAGGAPDTGGQVVYVNALARTLVELGYDVTVASRGGFADFDGGPMREGTAALVDGARYLFVPGGGDTFLPKERIAVALDEQVAWLHAHLARDAAALGCAPWERFGLINSHYWDAGVLAQALVERWRDDVGAGLCRERLADRVGAAPLQRLWAERHARAVGGCLPATVGRLLAGTHEAGGDPAEIAALQDEGLRALDALDAAHDGPGWRSRLAAVDRHVWTPHSLAALKQENFRDRPVDEIRALRLCERRSHERMLTDRVRAFAATSPAIAGRLCDHHGVDPARVFMFPPCVDATAFRPYPADELGPAYTFLAARTGLDEAGWRRARVVFEASRMDDSKRKDLLVDAFADAAATRPDAHLLIAGGPDNDVHRDLLARRDASPVLRERMHVVLGRIPDPALHRLFALADVYATPSEMEGFGMSAAQAAAAGTALVAADTVPFAVRAAAHGAIVVPAGERAAFGAAIGALLDDPADRRRRGEALMRATAALDWRAVTGRFLAHVARLETTPPGFAPAAEV